MCIRDRNTVSHITGGGFIENVPRMLPDGLKAVIRKGTWDILPIFDVLQEKGNIPEMDMYNTCLLYTSRCV